MPLFNTVLVRKRFLTVSAGRPNMSTSTYVDTRLSDKNWPDITLKNKNVVQIIVFSLVLRGKTIAYLN